MTYTVSSLIMSERLPEIHICTMEKRDLLKYIIHLRLFNSVLSMLT